MENERIYDMLFGMPFASTGDHVKLYPLTKIVRSHVITIGSHVIIDDFVFLDGGIRTTIGDYVHIAAFTSIMGGGEFVMEDFAGLSGGVRVYTAHESYLGEYLTNPTVPAPYRGVERQEVIMRKHSLVGANSVVLPGVEIGEGAAVGALSLVTQDLAPWTVYAGIPAKPIKERDKDNMLRLERQLRENLG
jgi:galactoside O-acetyltransferase